MCESKLDQRRGDVETFALLAGRYMMASSGGVLALSEVAIRCPRPSCGRRGCAFLLLRV
jgi:hypothetical protein